MMSLSIYTNTVPQFTRMLSNLEALLKKAQAYAQEKKIDETILLNARLFPDMFPLLRQVQIACDFAKGAAGRLAGVELPKFEDNEKTFDELFERIAKTQKFIGDIAQEKFEGSENRQINLTVAGRELNFAGAEYLIGFVLPNFYFHITTAYAILRHNGVEIGKRDYVGNV